MITPPWPRKYLKWPNLAQIITSQHIYICIYVSMHAVESVTGQSVGPSWVYSWSKLDLWLVQLQEKHWKIWIFCNSSCRSVQSYCFRVACLLEIHALGDGSHPFFEPFKFYSVLLFDVAWAKVQINMVTHLLNINRASRLRVAVSSVLPGGRISTFQLEIVFQERKRHININKFVRWRGGFYRQGPVDRSVSISIGCCWCCSPCCEHSSWWWDGSAMVDAVRNEVVVDALDVGNDGEDPEHSWDDPCDVPLDLVVETVADDPTGLMAVAIAVCLAEVDAAHDDADPDVEAPSSRCVTCWVLDADDEQAGCRWGLGWLS